MTPRSFPVLLAFMLTVVSVGRASEQPAIDFDTEIIPILTRSGCNAGACHGAAAGRGEFRLSLYGGDPARDYRAIVLEMEGRRINLRSPDESLVLLKPTEAIGHGGGTILDADDKAVQILRNWIAGGAPRLNARRLRDLQVEPARRVVSRLDSVVKLQARAQFDDGTQRDVTPWTVFTAEDPAAVEIYAGDNTATIKRRGRHIVIARYLDRVMPLVLIAPLSDAAVDLSREPRHNFIDNHVLDTLSTLRIPASAAADDSTFLRRAMLDLTGRLPTAAAAREFLTDKQAHKRQRLIDTLLASDEFTAYWTYKFAKLLRIRSQPQDTKGARTYHEWLRDQIAAKVGFDRIARQLLVAEGDSHLVGPANFYRTVGGAREQAEFVSELFMGSRLRCANCHNHPLDRWTQDDYHGLAAVFARLQRGRVIKVASRGNVIHPGTGEAALARIPGQQFIETDQDGRAVFADWLATKDNPYFAKALVNRLWQSLMGRGLVESVDDLRATNPATHPELLQHLADDFAANHFDLRHTLRLIANSAAYGRSPQTVAENKSDDRFYSHALVRPLEPEVLADALSDVTGVATKYGKQPLGTRAVTLFDAKIPAPELDVLGRCGREDSCESAAASSGGLPRKLHLFNGPLINRRIQDSRGHLATTIAANKKDTEIVDDFYWRALSRSPTAEENRFWVQQISNAKGNEQRKELLQDFVWGLCTCREFVTNH